MPQMLRPWPPPRPGQRLPRGSSSRHGPDWHEVVAVTVLGACVLLVGMAVGVLL